MKAGIERRIRALEAEKGAGDDPDPKGLRGLAGKPRRGRGEAADGSRT